MPYVLLHRLSVRTPWVAAVLIACAGCRGPGTADDSPPMLAEALPHIREASVSYVGWARVSDAANWSPTLCGSPRVGIMRTEVPDASPHGDKLYFLYAKEPRAYPHYDSYAAIMLERPESDPEFREPSDQPVGQVIVKQAFRPERLSEEEYKAVYDANQSTPHVLQSYARDRKGYARTGRIAGLFMMLKLDPTTPGTDQGWVYATVESSGDISAAGRIASCMQCHQSAENDRLFGPQWTRGLQRAKPPAR
jgi:hypothetical protein